MAVAIALILQALSLFLQWLSFRKQKGRPLTDREKRAIGHIAAQMQTCIQLATELGVTPKIDDEAVLEL